jgi:very-short-patch-repair endonuclease
LNTKKIFVGIACHGCGSPTNKSLEYLLRRVRDNKTQFFCSRKCSDKHHAEKMSGEGNPNYNGTFYGKTMAELSEEERKERGKKASETMLRNGTAKGANNGRWRGGRQEVNCIMCNKAYTVAPYVHDKIQAGERKPCCGRDCARIYAQTQVKTSRTSIEIKMADELNSRGIEYIDQHNLGNKFALDFFLPKYNIVIECDGNYWHTLPDVVKRDKSKNAYIKACDLSLYRFWESEINMDVGACVDVVMAEINTIDAV